MRNDECKEIGNKIRVRNFSKSPLLIAFFSRTTEKAASFVLMREFFFAFIVA
jgi:hypothetical protein